MRALCVDRILSTRRRGCCVVLVKARGYGGGNCCLMVLVEIPTFSVSTRALHATLKTMHTLDFYLAFVVVPPLPPNAHCTDIRVTCQTRSPRSSSTFSPKQRCQFNSKRKLLPSSAKPSACISPQLATINNGNYVNVSLKWPSGRMPEEKKN